MRGNYRVLLQLNYHPLGARKYIFFLLWKINVAALSNEHGRQRFEYPCSRSPQHIEWTLNKYDLPLSICKALFLWGENLPAATTRVGSQSVTWSSSWLVLPPPFSMAPKGVVRGDYRFTLYQSLELTSTSTLTCNCVIYAWYKGWYPGAPLP